MNPSDVNPGNRGRGRPKGSPNKVGAGIRQAILRALEQVGGEDYLVGVAKAHPAVFCGLLGRVLPLQHTGEDGGPLTLTVVTGVPRASG